jgi:hypothetical protein
MKQNFLAPGKAILALTILSLTYITGTAQVASLRAAEPTVIPAQKLQATALNSSTVTISWQANTPVMASNDVELERSFDMADFKTICYIMAPESGEQAAPICGFKDRQAMLQHRTEAYYRLKQTDKAGNVTYSDVVTVKLK